MTRYAKVYKNEQVQHISYSSYVALSRKRIIRIDDFITIGRYYGRIDVMRLMYVLKNLNSRWFYENIYVNTTVIYVTETPKLEGRGRRKHALIN